MEIVGSNGEDYRDVELWMDGLVDVWEDEELVESGVSKGGRLLKEIVCDEADF